MCIFGRFGTELLLYPSTLWAWGGDYYHRYGVNGDGTIDIRKSPVMVMENVKSVSAGPFHTMIVKRDGTLWATGANSGVAED